MSLLRSVLAIFLIINLTGFVSAETLTVEDRRRLEEELAKIEKEISETEGVISGYREQEKTLKKEIGRHDEEIKNTNLKIKALTLSISKLDVEIDENKTEVAVKEEKLNEHKRALRAALQNMYEQESETIIEILLQSPSISHFFSGINGLLEIQESLNASLRETLVLRDQLLNEREKFALSRADQENLRTYRDVEKKSLQTKKEGKKTLLEVTKGVEEKYQQLLQDKRQTAAQIRNRIFEFLGGGQLTFEQAYKLAKSAGDLTGTRPAIILAVLDKESALGQNVGKCSYKEAMHPVRDLPIFLEIAGKLGLNPDTLPVSCPIAYDGAYGGAMGPAQFIPSTWKIYEGRIAALTGNNPPSPWRNFDAFVGTALYLKDAHDSSACVAYSQEIPEQAAILQDRCAAAKYYAGSRWRTYRWTYGERVVKKAAQFEEDIAQITS